jgi:2Fe-2S ferredoxin
MFRQLVRAGSALPRRATLTGRGTARALSAKVPITFVDKDGTEIPVEATVGKSLLEVAHENDIELEGACDGSLACSTCHLILDDATFAKLRAPGEEEMDMLDLAFDLQATCVTARAAAARRQSAVLAELERGGAARGGCATACA